MAIKEVETDRICRDCGKSAYSEQIGWTDEEGIIHWHRPRNFNQCRSCRKETYRKIEEKKKINRDALRGVGETGGRR